MRTLLIIITLLVAVSPAFADVPASCVETVCGPASNHPGATYACDQSCECMDACGGASGGGGNGGGLGGALVKGTVKLIGATAVAVAFVFMPGHVAEALDKHGPKQTAEEARAEWSAFANHRDALIDAGKQAEKSRKVLLTLDAEERAELRDQVNEKKKPQLKPFNPPKLRPDPGFQCRQAFLRITTIANAGAIGPFPSEQDMRTKCSQFAPPPAPPDKTCTAGVSRPCGLTPEVCCPNGSPIYNTSDGQCYPEWNFVQSPNGLEGMHGAPRECGALAR